MIDIHGTVASGSIQERARMTFSRIKRLAVLSVVAATLSACGAAERLENIGKAPEMSPITNPTQRTDYRRVSMPMPDAANAGSRAEFPVEGGRTRILR